MHVTQEFKQFEMIFIYRLRGKGEFFARIFTCDGELFFSGDPSTSAEVLIHKLCFSDSSEHVTIIRLDKRKILLFYLKMRIDAIQQ